jgi:hypothetical protein
MCSTLIIISVFCFYLRSRAFAVRVYIRLQLIPVTLIILAIGTMSFNIVSALIRVLIECSLQRAEGALLLESELESEGILYHSYSSSSSSLLERLVRESAGSNSLLDNLKLGKLNKSDSIVKVKG